MSRTDLIVSICSLPSITKREIIHRCGIGHLLIHLLEKGLEDSKDRHDKTSSRYQESCIRTMLARSYQQRMSSCRVARRRARVWHKPTLDNRSTGFDYAGVDAMDCVR